MWAIINDPATQITLVVSVIMIAVMVYVIKYVAGHMQKSSASVPAGEQTFDGIAEGISPTPVGLHFIMGGLIIFFFWYIFAGYPIWTWTQEGQYDDEVAAYKQTFDETWKNADENTLIAMGESIFNAKCVACHGYTGEGQNGMAANLVEYGTEKHISKVIRNGSKGLGYLTPIMPPQAPVLEVLFGKENLEKNISDAAAYVMQLSGRTPAHGNPAEGLIVFKAVCQTCHGPEGKGRGPGGNIPNFSKDLTTYATDVDVIRTLQLGKKGDIGIMPNFAAEGTLSEIQYRAVAAFVSTELHN
ncbi:MAG: c-type cytochrome [SAR324 cluster bacterium]|nr:c-type cytochrome [SAR324 cluster bacterium]MBL7034798.1 c-type cytochrome [SAR324 cluster bacterium]